MKILHRIVCLLLALVMLLDPAIAASIRACKIVRITPTATSVELFEKEAVVPAPTEFWQSLDLQARIIVRHLERRFIQAPSQEYPITLQAPEIVADMHINKTPAQRRAWIYGVRLIHAAMRAATTLVWKIWSVMSALSSQALESGWKPWLEAALHRRVNIGAHVLWNMGPAPLTLPEPISSRDGCKNLLNYLTALRGEGDIVATRQRLLSDGAFSMPATVVTTNGASSPGLFFGTHDRTHYLIRLDIPEGTPVTIMPERLIPAEPEKGVVLHLKAGEREWFFRVKGTRFYIEEAISRSALDMILYSEALQTESDLTHISAQILARGPQKFTTKGEGPAGTRLNLGSAFGKPLATTFKIPPDSEMTITPIAAVEGDSSHGVYFLATCGSEQWYFRLVPKKGTIEIITSPAGEIIEHYVRTLLNGEDITRAAQAIASLPPIAMKTTKAGLEGVYSYMGFGTVSRKRVGMPLSVPPGTAIQTSFIPVFQDDLSAGVYLRVEISGVAMPEERVLWFAFDKRGKGYLRAIDSPQAQNLFNYRDAVRDDKERKRETRVLFENGSWTVVTRPITDDKTGSRLYIKNFGGTPLSVRVEAPPGTPVVLTPRLLIPDDPDAGLYLEINAAGKLAQYFFRNAPKEKTGPKPLRQIINHGNPRIAQYVNALIQSEDLTTATRELVLNGPFELPVGRGEKMQRIGVYSVYMGTASTPNGKRSITTMLKLSKAMSVKITPILRVPGDFSKGADLRLEADGQTWYVRFKTTPSFFEKINLPFTDNLRELYDASVRGDQKTVAAAAHILMANNPAHMVTRSEPEGRAGYSELYLCYTNQMSYDLSLRVPPATPVQVTAHYVNPETPGNGLFFEAVAGTYRFFFRFDAISRVARRVDLHGTEEARWKPSGPDEEASIRRIKDRIFSIYPNILEEIPYDVPPPPSKPTREPRPAVLKPVLPALGDDEMGVRVSDMKKWFTAGAYAEIQKLKDRLQEAAKAGEEEVMLGSIRFQLRQDPEKPGPQFLACKVADLPALADLMEWKWNLRSVLESLGHPGENDVVVSMHGLEKVIRGKLAKRAKDLETKLNELAKNDAETTLYGIRFRRMRVNKDVKWAFDKADAPALALALQAAPQTDTALQPGEIVVNPESLKDHYVGGWMGAYKKLKARIETAAGDKKEVDIEDVVFHWRWTPQGHYWAFDETQVEKVARFMGFILQSDAKTMLPVQPDDFMIIVESIEPMFIGDAADIAKAIRYRLDDAAKGRVEIIVEGITFRRRKSAPHYPWSIHKDDLDKFISAFHLALRSTEEGILPIQPGEMSVSASSLHPHIFGDAQNISSWLTLQIISAAQGKLTAEVGGVTFTKRLNGTVRSWVFDEKRLPDVLAYLTDNAQTIVTASAASKPRPHAPHKKAPTRFKTVQARSSALNADSKGDDDESSPALRTLKHIGDPKWHLPSPAEDDIPITQDGMQENVIGSQKLAKRLNKLLDAAGGDAVEVVIHGITARRKISNGWRIWTIQQDDFIVFAMAEGLTLRTSVADLPILQPGQITISIKTLRDTFVGDGKFLQKQLLARIAKERKGDALECMIGKARLVMAYYKPVRGWVFDESQAPALAEAMGWTIQPPDGKIESFGPDDVSCSGNSLQDYFIGEAGGLSRKLRAKIKAAAGIHSKVEIDGIEFRFVYNDPRYTWSFKVKDVEAVAKMMGWRLQTEKSQYPKVVSGQIPVQGRRLTPYFPTHPYKLAKNLVTMIAAAAGEEDEVVLGGVRFWRAMHRSKRVWAFNEEDLALVAKFADRRFTNEGYLDQIQAGEIALTPHGLGRRFIGHWYHLLQELSKKLASAPIIDEVKTLDGIPFYRRFSKNQRVWAIREEDVERLGHLMHWEPRAWLAEDVALSSLSLEEELAYWRGNSRFDYDLVSPRVWRYLVTRLSERLGIPVTQLTLKDFRLPCPELSTENRTRSLTSLYESYLKQSEKRGDNGEKPLERLLADIGLVGPQSYTDTGVAVPTCWQRIEQMAQILKVERVFVDLDETLVWPDGWVASEEWLAMRREHSPTTAYNELLAEEARMVKAGYIVATDPEAVAVIRRLQARGVEVVGLTARAGYWDRRVRRILRSNGIDFSVEHVGSHQPEAKLQRITKLQGKRSSPALYVDDDVASIEAVEAADLPDVKTAVYAPGRPPRWTDPLFYLERAQQRVNENHPQVAQEDLINALELSERPGVAYADRVLILNAAAPLLEQLQALSIDASPSFRAYLKQGAGLLADRESATAKLNGDFQQFLTTFFGHYFPSNAASMVQYYNDGLIQVRRRRSGARESYYFVVDETNAFAYIEPILRRILHEKPRKVFVIDSGARPFLWAIEAAVKAMNLPIEVCLLPLSLKTKGDTLPSTRYWLSLGREVAEGRLVLETFEEGIRGAVAAFASLFPLEGASVLIVDDNMSGGDTIDTAHRALAAEGALDMGAGVVWAMRDGKVARSDVTETFASPGQSSWAPGRYPPVTVHTAWEANLHLRGIRSRDAYNGNPIPTALTEEDPDYGAYLNFRERLVANLLAHLARYRENLDTAPTRAGPTLESEDETIPEAAAIPIAHEPTLPEFTLTLGDRTLTCQPVHTAEQLIDYISRPDARPIDAMGDQLTYPDLTVYQVVDADEHVVGVFEAVQGLTRRSHYHDKAIVIDYVDLDYNSDIDPKEFMDALVSAATTVGEQAGADWILMPKLEWMIAGRPELTGVLQNDDSYRRAPVLRDIIVPEETAQDSEAIRAYNHHPETYGAAILRLLDRLSTLLSHERLLEIDERARYLYEQGLFDYTAGQSVDPAWARLLRHRFRSLSRNRFRVLWHRVSPEQSKAVEPFQRRLDAIRPYVFEDYEIGMAAQLDATLRMGMPPGPYLESFLQRLERRRRFFENREEPAQPWQTRFLPMRDMLGEWTREDKLAYQALEFYSLKIDAEDEEKPRYPSAFFDGADGAVRAAALLRHVVFDVNRLYDLRLLRPRFFADQDLDAIWERVYNRNLSQVAETLYPGQYEYTSDTGLQPKPLTSREIIQWYRTGLPLAPGRTVERNLSSFADSIGVNFSVNQMGRVWMSIPQLKHEEVRQKNIDRVTVATISDPNQGLMLGLFEPGNTEETLVLYSYSSRNGAAAAANLFMMDLNKLRSGQAVATRPGPPTFFKSTVNVMSQGTGKFQCQLMPFDINISLYLPADIVSREHVTSGDTLIAVIMQDINQGTVVNLYREKDFDPKTGLATGAPLLSYGYLRIGQAHGWASFDLATADLLALSAGQPNIHVRDPGAVVHRELPSGHHVSFKMALGEEDVKTSFAISEAELRELGIQEQHIPLDFEIYDDPDFGPYIQISTIHEGARKVIQTHLGRRPGYNTDLNRAALVGYTLAEKNIHGHLIEPRPYRHPTEIRAGGNLNLSGIVMGQAVRIYGLNSLIGKRPIFVPERNLQHGWIIKVHDADAYALDPNRSPDILLVRDSRLVSLVPLDDFEKTILTDEDRGRFKEMAETINLQGILDLGAAVGPLLYQYLRLKFPGYFALGKLPLVLQDWLSRRALATAPGGKQGGGSVPKPARQTPSRPTEQPTNSTIDVLANIRQRAIYQSMINNQEAAMMELKSAAENHPDEEWKQVNRRVYDYFRGIVGMDLPELNPAGRRLLKLFQLEGIRHLIDHPQAALWDDPGLGKTVQAIAAALHIPRRNPDRANLICSVVPASGVKVWRDEIAKWARHPHDIIVMGTGGMATLYTGPEDTRGTRLTLKEAMARYERNPPQHSPFVLVTYDALKGSFYGLWNSLGSLEKEYPEISAGLFGTFDDFVAQYQRYDADWSEAKILATLEDKLRPSLGDAKLADIRERLAHHIRSAYGTTEDMRLLHPDIMIVDEAHKLRNEETLQSQTLQSLTAPHKMMLSGRPLLSRDRAKLFPMLNWLMPERFPDYAAFLKQYPDTLEGRMELWLAMQDFALRRRKREVLLPGELPPLTPHEEHIAFNAEDEETYRQMEGDFRAWLDSEVARTGHLPGMDHVFSQLTRLAQFTSGLRFRDGAWVFDGENPKVKALDEIVKAKMDAGEKIVIFTQFVEVAEALRQRYESLGVAYLAGNVGIRTRDKTVERFQTDPGTRVCVATYGTGGETITLTAANNAVLYDLEYDVPEQPKDRIERLGQTREMHLYTLVMDDSIDTDLLQLHAQKQEVFDQLIEGFFPPAVLLQELANSLAETIGVITEGATSPFREMLEAFLFRPNGNSLKKAEAPPENFVFDQASHRYDIPILERALDTTAARLSAELGQRVEIHIAGGTRYLDNAPGRDLDLFVWAPNLQEKDYGQLHVRFRDAFNAVLDELRPKRYDQEFVLDPGGRYLHQGIAEGWLIIRHEDGTQTRLDVDLHILRDADPSGILPSDAITLESTPPWRPGGWDISTIVSQLKDLVRTAYFVGTPAVHERLMRLFLAIENSLEFDVSEVHAIMKDVVHELNRLRDEDHWLGYPRTLARLQSRAA